MDQSAVVPEPSSYTTGDLSARVGGKLRGRGDLRIAGVNAVDVAEPDQITFIADERHARLWHTTRGGAAVISEGFTTRPYDETTRALIVVPNAAVAMIDLLHLFEPPAPQPEPGVHASAIVHSEATLGKDVRIGPHVTVDARAIVGDRVVLHAGVRLYSDTSVGDDSILHSNVVVRERCRLGARVLIHSNASIGSDGFGFVPAPDGSGVLKVPQVGTVDIGDEVEIGAGTCVDRAKFGATTIGRGTKLDNLVQIGHNCRIGRGCVIAGLTGISGSVVVGDGVRIGGAVGIADHVRIGNRATIGAKSGVYRDVPDGVTQMGTPAQESRTALRQIAAVRKLPELLQLISRFSAVGRP